MKLKKSNYVCMVPFTAIEVHDNRSFLCCASWLKKYLPYGMGIKESWNSQEAKDIRDSMLDGSYKFCDSVQCPFLNKLENGIVEPNVLVRKSVINSNPDGVLSKAIEKHKDGVEYSPTNVQFSFDRTCNLKCPSCRIDLFVADSKKIKSVKATIDEIENEYSNNIETLYITGSGDPFISVGFRDFLRNFDKRKYPKLKRIHLHTNATKWNKEMWDSMKNIHPYVVTCEISIDAGTKDTYENKTRINGDWDELIENLKFISTIPNLTKIKPSFVVQNHNYKEMKIFYDLMLDIFGKKATVFFGKINNWGTFGTEEFAKHKVWDESHENYSEFVNEVNNLLPANQSFNNLEEFITYKKTII